MIPSRASTHLNPALTVRRYVIQTVAGGANCCVQQVHGLRACVRESYVEDVADESVADDGDRALPQRRAVQVLCRHYR